MREFDDSKAVLAFLKGYDSQMLLTMNADTRALYLAQVEKYVSSRLEGLSERKQKALIREFLGKNAQKNVTQSSLQGRADRDAIYGQAGWYQGLSVKAKKMLSDFDLQMISEFTDESRGKYLACVERFISINPKKIASSRVLNVRLKKMPHEK